MKKRFLSLLLVFGMAFCLLLPFGAHAAAGDRGDDCYAFLKNYLQKNGKFGGGVYTYSGAETSDDVSFDVTVIYDPDTDQLRFGVSQKQGLASYSAEVIVPSALEMPYDASQTLTYIGVMSSTNNGQISSDFTTQSQVPLSGNTYDTEKIFPFAIALALRHAQDHLLYGSGYTIADLGFTALFGELYGDHVHEAVSGNAVAATCTEAGFSGDQFCAICGEPMGAGKVIPALGHKTETRNAKDATETEPGYTGDEVCTVCGEVMSKGETIPAQGLKACPSRDFTDVDRSEKSWYHEAVDWAVTANVTKGVSPTSFGPNRSCTRGQMVTFLWRAKGSPEPKSTNNPFVDVPEGAYYTKAVLWALENRITNGVDPTHFGPDASVKRSQTVTFLWRMQGWPFAERSTGFTDVPRSSFYTTAVAWAVANGITNGVDATHFAPDDDCTRAQIVTFLHRAIVR